MDMSFNWFFQFVAVVFLLLIESFLILWYITKSKEDKEMAVIYATLIIKGKRTFASVPSIIKDQVREILIELEVEELIVE